MKSADDLRRTLNKVFATSIAVAAVSAAISLIGAFTSPVHFFQSYMLGFHFWLALSLGSIALLALASFFHADWTLPIRRPLESGAKTIVLMLFLFVPILFALHILFEWTVPEIVASSVIIQRKSGYLNVPFFVVRAALYFALWLLLTWLLLRWAPRARQEDYRRAWTRRAVCVAAMVLYFVSVTFASVDWGMSITAAWYSTGYSLLYIIGQCLTAFAFVVAVVLLIADYEPMRRAINGQRMHDWGNFLRMFIMLWAYLEAVQFIIIWSGNLQVDNTWYYYRARNGWQYVGTFMILCNFFLPFFALLFRFAKRHVRALLGIAFLLFAVRVVEMFWMIIPSYHRDAFHLDWMNIVVPMAMGGIWMSVFCWDFRRRPVVEEFAFVKEAHE